MELLIPILGVLTGMVVPIAAFVWLYFDSKNKRDSVIEIAKNLDNPEQVEKLMAIFDERKKEPIDYRRGGLITMFVGIGIFLLGYIALGSFFKGIGLLVGAIGLGTLLAGYLYPNTSEELTNAVEEFEKK
ncbi:DUF6249 domain-containing protein [bacterium]|nr:DUF6249 domain-containing protein [bacterium]MDA7699355.1 DUF6249 domain-containing protein [bacterium]